MGVLRCFSNTRFLIAIGGIVVLTALIVATASASQGVVRGATISAPSTHAAHGKKARHKRRNRRIGGRRRVTRAVPVSQGASQRGNGLLFSGSRIQDFEDNQSAPGAVTEVADPAGSGRQVLKMAVDNGDVAPVTPTDNPRAQLDTPAFVPTPARRPGGTPASTCPPISPPKSPAG